MSSTILRAPGDRRHPATPPTCCARSMTGNSRAGRLRQPGSLALSRAATPSDTIAEARRLWGEVDRAEPDGQGARHDGGVPAIRALIGEGINVNVTLLFSQRRLQGGGRSLSWPGWRRSPPAAAIVAVSPASPASSSAASTPRSTERSTAASAADDPDADALQGAARQGRHRQRQARLSPVPGTDRQRRAGRRWPRPARRRSGCCGPAPAPRTRPTATCSMSRS